MSIPAIVYAKQLKAAGERLDRAGLSERVIDLVAEFDGSYKGAMKLAGRLKAIAGAAKFDGYWTEQVDEGFHAERKRLIAPPAEHVGARS
jgi:hypothetical protein